MMCVFKETITMAVLGFLVAAGHCAEKVEDYPVREIDQSSAKFDKIYKAVADADEQRRKANLKTSTVRILQNISEGVYLVERGDKTYALYVPGGKAIADDTELDLPVTVTDETVQYKTVLGAKKTVAVMTVSEPVERLTKKEVIQALMGGAEIVIVLKVGERGCGPCYGSGRVGSNLKKTRRPCRACGGSKKQVIMKKFRIRW